MREVWTNNKIVWREATDDHQWVIVDIGTTGIVRRSEWGADGAIAEVDFSGTLCRSFSSWGILNRTVDRRSLATLDE